MYRTGVYFEHAKSGVRQHYGVIMAIGEAGTHDVRFTDGLREQYI